ncbi:Rho GTPase activation protein [Coniella lustricola]|uniref:Rho GTPase activation protein n=1 Tax=Coniella lustricola TaxID=2025994 RepID=A0A2T3AJM3_9PEZI|nr:Rho GTPase activation protein [Coniella lustricola]
MRIGQKSANDHHCYCIALDLISRMRESRQVVTPDLQPRLSASSSSFTHPVLPVNKGSSGVRSSATWASTSGDLGGMSDTDEIHDREEFVVEYNRLAQKHGVRLLVPDNNQNLGAMGIHPKRGWFSRTFRRASSQSTENSVRRQRSFNHMATHIAHPKKDSLKDQDLQGLVRLCGKSFLYLPPEYATGSLVLPTCFRATAQYLIQHAPETRGVFRIPGSIRVVNELYEFYCTEQVDGDIANTVRSPNLPTHINMRIHDVASCFKKFLSGLPGGILGSLSLFDALVAINSQLFPDPEFSRTKQSKIRARLVALAIGTLRSQFRRELICAVFGLLCFLGRAAEVTPREDGAGHPLPTSDLMGYNALGIIFGPLLVGEMLGSYKVKLADPSAGLYLVPESPSPKSKKEKRKLKEVVDEPQQPFLEVDKIHVANDITEMLITNWRDIVRQMKNLEGSMTTELLRRRRPTSTVTEDEPRLTRSSIGRSLEADQNAGRKTYDWNESNGFSRRTYRHEPVLGEPKSSLGTSYPRKYRAVLGNLLQY